MDDIYLILLVCNVLILMLIFIIILVTPLISNKSLLFGVRLPITIHKNHEIKAIKKTHYLLLVITFAILICILMATYIYYKNLMLYFTIYIPYLSVILFQTVYFYSHKKTLDYKKINNIKVEQVNTIRYCGVEENIKMPNMYYYISVAIIFIFSLFLIIYYPNIPDVIPTHTDFNGVVTGYTVKSLWSVFMLPIIALLTTVLMYFCNIILLRAKLQISLINPKLSFEQHKVYKRKLSKSFAFLNLGIVIIYILIGFFSVTGLLGTFEFFNILLFLIVLGSTFPLLFVVVKSGQGGNMIKINEDLINIDDNLFITEKSISDDDRKWVGGIFYYNKEDSTVFIENRFGSNIGVNYATLAGKIIVICSLLIIIATLAIPFIID